MKPKETPGETMATYRFPTIDMESVDSDLSDNEAAGEENDLLSSIESQAYQAGYAEAKEQTLIDEKKRQQPIEALLSESRRVLKDHMLNVAHRVENDVIQGAVAMARAILRHEINERPDNSMRIMRKALQMARGQACIKIKANPVDGETARNLLHEEIQDTDAVDKVEVVADKSIDPGGCLIETDFGNIDARIEQQLNSAASQLKSQIMTESKMEVEGTYNIPKFDHFHHTISGLHPINACGHVTKVVGLVVEANGPVMQMGSLCDIHGVEGEAPVTAEVLGFRDRTVLMMPLEEIRSIGPGSRVVARQERASVAVGPQLLGRVIDGLGNPIDGAGPLFSKMQYPIYTQPINPLLRQRIRTPLDLGIRAINGLLTVGCGQRMGIFAGSGVGKSVLMGMIARKSQADVNVIALIGERGRELNEFIDKELGEEGLKKSVVVVATSDHLPLVRVRGAFVATALAEYFRDEGMHVNLMMDSLTRFAMAQREIGLALGEPPTTKGYTPSVFTLLPKLLERAGTSDHKGTITGLYTVLVEGDDMNEPIADAARSILDGHVVLTRELADRNHYPAIDVLKSISRVMEDIASLQHKHNCGSLKELLATYRKAEDLINIGAYVSGSNPAIDRSIEKIERINDFLKQDISESVGLEQSLQELAQIINS
jgi:flagellum-specific ATP synthase